MTLNSSSLKYMLFDLKKQKAFINSVMRLASVGIHQREIAEQLVKYGSAQDALIGNDILNAIEVGNSFIEGVKPWVDPLVFEALLVGQKTGNWVDGLENALRTLEMSQASTVTLAKTMAKPILTFIALLAVSGATYKYFFPMVGTMMPQNRWGGLTQTAYSFGQFCSDNGEMGLTIFIALIIAVTVSLPIFVGELRGKIDNFPVYRQYRLIKVSNFLTSLSNLASAGFGLRDSIDTLAPSASIYAKSHLNLMMERIEDGAVNVGDILDTGFLDPAEIRTLKLLGEIGGVEDTLKLSADMHKALLLLSISRLTEIGASAIKLIGLAVGVLMGGGVLMLIMDIATNIRV